MLFCPVILKKMKLINSYNTKNTELIHKGYSVHTGEYIRRGWDLFRKRTDYFILFTLVFFIASSIPLADLLLIPPLAAGFILVAHYLASGKQVYFEDFFNGFRHFAELFLFTLIAIVLVFIAFLALILPGIYLSVGYIFVPFYIIFGKMGFWEAMEASRLVIHREWFGIFGFVLVLIMINILGFMALGIGLLITVPLSYCALYAAFDDIVGISN